MDPSHLYFSASTYNADASPTASLFPQQLSVDVLRSAPLLRNPSAYKAYIARATLVTSSQIPVLEARIVPGQVTQTAWAFQVTWSVAGTINSPTFTATQYVTWLPDDVTVPAGGKEWRWAHSLGHVASLMNTALGQAMASLGQQFAQWWVAQGNTDPCPAIASSVSYAQERDGRVSFAFVQGKDEALALQGNWQLTELLWPFPWTYIGGAGGWSALQTKAGVATSNGVVVTSEAAPSSTWSPCSSIVLTGSVGVVPEQAAPPTILGTSTGAENNSAPILLDIAVAPTTALDWSGLITFTPSTKRWLSCSTGAPITSLDFKAWWRHVDGSLVPLLALPGASFSLKIGWEML